MNKKMRKTINISLQSKKYAKPINKIINEWEEEGSNTSAQVCEIMMLFDKYDKSITLSNVKNIFEIVEKMVGMYADLEHPDTRKLIEEILSKVITIDNSQLSIALTNLNSILPKTIVKTSPTVETTAVEENFVDKRNTKNDTVKDSIAIDNEPIINDNQNIIKEEIKVKKETKVEENEFVQYVEESEQGSPVIQHEPVYKPMEQEVHLPKVQVVPQQVVVEETINPNDENFIPMDFLLNS